MPIVENFLRASSSWSPKGPSRPVTGQLTHKTCDKSGIMFTMHMFWGLLYSIPVRTVQTQMCCCRIIFSHKFRRNSGIHHITGRAYVFLVHHYHPSCHNTISTSIQSLNLWPSSFGSAMVTTIDGRQTGDLNLLRDRPSYNYRTWLPRIESILVNCLDTGNITEYVSYME
jgi:hypothetical protein